MTPVDERVATNQRRWEEMTELHLVTYRVEERDAVGQFSLKPFEPAELGSVEGLRICHLQCHLGENSFAHVIRPRDLHAFFRSRAEPAGSRGEERRTASR